MKLRPLTPMDTSWRAAGGCQHRLDAGIFAVVIEPASVGWGAHLYLDGNARHAATHHLGFYPDEDTAKREAPRDAAKVWRTALEAMEGRAA